MASENVELERTKDFLRMVLKMDLSSNDNVRLSMMEEFGEKWREYRRLVIVDDCEEGFITGVRVSLRKFELYRNKYEVEKYLEEDLWKDMDDDLEEATRRLRENAAQKR